MSDLENKKYGSLGFYEEKRPSGDLVLHLLVDEKEQLIFPPQGEKESGIIWKSIDYWNARRIGDKDTMASLSPDLAPYSPHNLDPYQLTPNSPNLIIYNNQ